MTRPPVGVVLAGGASTRLGRDKTLIELDGMTLAAATAARLRAVCAEVVIADNGRKLVEGHDSLPDGPARGPAAGILGAAAARRDRDLLVLACDLPRVPVELLDALTRQEEGDWVLPRWAGGIEPLCSLFRPQALSALARLARRGTYAPHRLLEDDRLSISYLDEHILLEIGEPQELFLNVNTPEELGRLQSR